VDGCVTRTILYYTPNILISPALAAFEKAAKSGGLSKNDEKTCVVYSSEQFFGGRGAHKNHK